jgi:hypothetical protein
MLSPTPPPSTPPHTGRLGRRVSPLAALALLLVCWLTLPSSSLAAARRSPARHSAAEKRCVASSSRTVRGVGSASHSRFAHHCSKLIRGGYPGGRVIGPVSSTPVVSAEGPSVVWAPPAPASPHAPPVSNEVKGTPRQPEETNGVLSDPIDPRFLTEVPFGTSSFWIQPWRAYIDTWPASTVLNSLGINFNVGPASADNVARLLQESGFTLARREIPWSSLSYEDPTHFNNEPRVRTILSALHNHGLRPLILLNANSGQPAPSKQVSLRTLSDAPAGATTVTLDAESAAEVVPGKTGFDELTFGTGPDVLITAVSPGNLATLSRPLTKPLPAGKHRATTLRYAPFQAPTLANGEPNPVFQETLAGWLSYLGTVSKEAASIFGPEGYDLEIWNELSFGSQFLNSEHYYQAVEPTPQDAEEDAETEESPEARQNSDALEKAVAETGAEVQPAAKTIINQEVTKTIRRALFKETVAYVRNPANGIPAGVGLSDGFASQTPFPSGAKAPIGLTALSKHLYNGVKNYPSAYPESDIRPLNALGFADYEHGTALKPLFIPTYQSLFPELYLTATKTETITRDIAPITTEIYDQAHGRNIGPAGGSPVQKWMTEYNLSPNKGTPVGPDGVTPANVTLTAADKAHFQAKALLRHLVAMVNKGLSRDYFFAAAPGALSLVGKSFYSALQANPETYPGAELGGETMTGFRNMLARFHGPGPGSELRQLKLTSIAQEGNHAQFTGDGTPAHPSLYDRDVLAVLPFQSSPTTFVIPVYVMTRDLLTLYEPGQPASDINRFDLPNETFRITLGNLPTTRRSPTVSGYDPLRNESTPARLVSRQGETAEFEFAATDYPRLLTVEF